jgi:thiamine kinase-like enzyme
MNVADPIQDAVEVLTGVRDARITPVADGGNSSLFRIETPHGNFALKRYPDERADPRRRRQTERDALQFLAEQGFSDVPVFLGSHERFSLYSWLGGTGITHPDESDVRQALDFWQRLRASSTVAEAERFGAAFEACNSLDVFLVQLSARAERLLTAVAHDGELLNFVRDEILLCLHETGKRVREMYHSRRLPTGVISRDEQQLIHGDYGIHNMLKHADGRIFVLDFEYFGWDDPIKMVADFVLHPGIPLSAALRERCLEMALACGRSADFSVRLEAQLPLFAVRWALITLNAFLPEKWAAVDGSEVLARWASMKEQQIPKARSLLKMCEQMRLR